MFQCDGCEEILPNIYWQNYLNHIKDDGKYYCKICFMKLQNHKSFYDWCYENLSKEEANKIMTRWDYDKNIKNNIKLTPKDIIFSSNGLNKKGYWFKCLDHPEHESELKHIDNLTGDKRNIKRQKNINCNQCNTILITHPHLIKYLINKINKKDTIKYSYGSKKKILIKCPFCNYEKKLDFNTLSDQGFSCPKCSDGISYPEKFIFNVLEWNSGIIITKIANILKQDRYTIRKYLKQGVELGWCDYNRQNKKDKLIEDEDKTDN